ncbi:MAG: hypothetical protein HY842_01585, partial [Bacteroidetes bacterium]|nr:hypothetical protein [Bacteroidota bacterium]
MRKILIPCFLFLFIGHLAQAQIINGQDTLYGNEWINFDQSYFKILVAEDGIYRVSQQVLTDANLPLGQVNGSQFQLFHNGEEVPLYLTTDGQLGSADYLEFFGKKNTSELDRYLFKDPDAEMMNPLYSLFTDTAAYFLTWKLGGGNLRYETIANDLTNLPGEEAYFIGELALNYFSNFQKQRNSQGISSSDYGLSEGYATNFANVQNFPIAPTSVYTGGPDAQLSIRYSGNLGQHQQNILLNDQLLTTDEFYDFQVRQLNLDVPNTTLVGAMTLKFQGTVSNTDNQRVANIILKYPRQFDFGNQTAFFFEMSPASGVRYLEIQNFNASNGIPILYDVANGQRLVATYENNLVKIALPPSMADRKLVLVNNNSGIKSVTALQPINFIDYGAMDAAYIILSNPKLYNDGNGNNYVQQYADYRSSATGGSFETVVVDVQQVYDQFGWGLNRHALSVRDFGHFVKKHWVDVKYFFVMGKGREYPNVRTQAQLISTSNSTYFVPTFGMPGSDNLLLAGADGFTPIIPIGRIAASTTEDIRIYLQKVKEFEANHDLPQTIADRAWMKNILHLGGGNGASASEQALIRSYLENMAEISKNRKMGTSTKAFYKTSTDPIQQPQTEDIFDYINNGVSQITFFGHSAVGVFDFSIDFPENYKNKGKYPWMISLGCYAGNIHTSSVGIGERFVLLEDGGSIAFTATAGQGYISSLNTFST